MAAIIEIKDLVKDFKLGEVPVHVLKDISFDRRGPESGWQTGYHKRLGVKPLTSP